MIGDMVKIEFSGDVSWRDILAEVRKGLEWLEKNIDTGLNDLEDVEVYSPNMEVEYRPIVCISRETVEKNIPEHSKVFECFSRATGSKVSYLRNKPEDRVFLSDFNEWDSVEGMF